MKNDRGGLIGCLALALTILCAPWAHAQDTQRTLGTWAEVPTVEDWLAEELRETRRALRGPTARGVQSDSPPASPAPEAVELMAVYGTQQAWAVDIRIGGHVHVLRSRGADSADDARGKQSIVADQREGDCLRLRYRATSRRLCVRQPKGEEAGS